MSLQWCVGAVVCRGSGVSGQWCEFAVVCWDSGVLGQWCEFAVVCGGRGVSFVATIIVVTCIIEDATSIV